MIFYIAPQIGNFHPTIILDFGRIWLDRSVVPPGENMIVFVFAQTVAKSRPVNKRCFFTQRAIKAHFFFQSAMRRRDRPLSRPRVAAAGVGPFSAAVVFLPGTPLEEHFFLPIENHNRKGAVQFGLAVRAHFFHSAHRFILLINQNHRKLLVMITHIY